MLCVTEELCRFSQSIAVISSFSSQCARPLAWLSLIRARDTAEPCITRRDPQRRGKPPRQSGPQGAISKWGEKGENKTLQRGNKHTKTQSPLTYWGLEGQSYGDLLCKMPAPWFFCFPLMSVSMVATQMPSLSKSSTTWAIVGCKPRSRVWAQLASKRLWHFRQCPGQHCDLPPWNPSEGVLPVTLSRIFRFWSVIWYNWEAT